MSVKYPGIILIFVSNREDLVFKTFSTKVFQFIRKRDYESDKINVFKQLEEHLRKNYYKKIIVVNGRKIVLIPQKINYIVSIGNDVIIHQEKEITIKASINSILEYLDYPYLVQVQRSLAVNCYFIKDFQYSNIITYDEMKYSIGRPYKEAFIKTYERYLLK